jgi:GT2 family glycosyltransferase
MGQVMTFIERRKMELTLCRTSPASNVWVVIPNRNGIDHLRYSLPELFKTAYKFAGVVLIDNVSSDCSVEFVKTNFPSIHVIVNATDRGFAGSVNIGISYAMSRGASLVAVFSNDIIVRSDWLDWAVAGMEASENTAAIGFEELPRSADADQMRAAPILTARIGPTRCPSGALTMYRTSVLKQVGPFDEGYYMYGEETDLYRRIERAGFDLVFCEIPFWHYGEGYSANLGIKRVWLSYRNAIRIAVKNERFWGRSRALIRLLHFGCNPFVSEEKRNMPAVKRLRDRNPIMNFGLVIAACWWNALHTRYSPVTAVNEKQLIKVPGAGK